jgi:hypothetical protein
MTTRFRRARKYVKQHRAATAVGLLVPPLVAGGLAVSAPSFADMGSHHVMAYVQPEVGSIFYSTSNNLEDSISFCATLSQHGSTEWVDGGMDILDSRAVRMITFQSTSCTDGYIKQFDLVGPTMDGNTNWWVDLQ